MKSYLITCTLKGVILAYQLVKGNQSFVGAIFNYSSAGILLKHTRKVMLTKMELCSKLVQVYFLVVVFRQIFNDSIYLFVGNRCNKVIPSRFCSWRK